MTKYFYIDNEAQKGPYTFVELKSLNIKQNTPIWHEGIENWTTASELEELKGLFVVSNENADIPVYLPQETRKPQENNTIPPKTWLVESILVTLFCCLPFGVAGIVFSSKVESLFYAGDIEGAERASREAGKWIKIGFWVGVIALGLYILYVVVVLVILAGSLSAIFNELN